jgi:hypothetical protein
VQHPANANHPSTASGLAEFIVNVIITIMRVERVNGFVLTDVLCQRQQTRFDAAPTP